MTQLSPHFSLEELTRSSTATAKGIDNTPGEKARANLVRLCRDILEPLRSAYGAPMRITSGFRCQALNKAIGGVATSQHVKGEAADIDVGSDNAKLFHLAVELAKEGKITAGQIIWEKGNQRNPAWVHISLPTPGRPVNQILYLGIKR